MPDDTVRLRLPIRSKLSKLETPASYASRLACQNGLPSVLEFCRDLGLEMQGIADGNLSMLQRLADLGGLQTNEISRWSVTKLEKAQYRVAGQLIEKRWIIRTSLRLCPCCIAVTDKWDDEGFVGQAVWHIPFFRQCSRHSVSLKSYRRVDHTGSVHDFTKRCFEHRWDILRAADDATVCDPSALSRYIEARSMGAPVKRWIDTLELNAAPYFCELLGLLVDRGADAGISALSDNERRRVGDIGYQIISGGTKNVVEALEGMPRPKVKSKAQAHLGSLYQ